MSPAWGVARPRFRDPGVERRLRRLRGPGGHVGVNVFDETQSPMRKISRLVLFLVIALVVGTAAFLATWDIPAPVTTIEKVIPDERFPR